MQEFNESDNEIFEEETRRDFETFIGKSRKKVMFKDSDDDSNLSDDDSHKFNGKPIPLVRDNKLADLFGLKGKDAGSKHLDPTNSTIKDPTIKKLPVSPLQSGLDKSQATEIVLRESDFIGPQTTPALPQSDQISKNLPRKKSIFDDEDLDSIMMPKSKPANSQAKKTSLMEDLFGSKQKSDSIIDKRMGSFNSDVPVTRSNTGESTTGFVSETSSKTSNTTGFSLTAQREPRRGRRASTVQNDPLGLLSASTLLIDDKPKDVKQIHPAQETVQSTAIDELPEWLGGPKVSKDQKSQETDNTGKKEPALTANKISGNFEVENTNQSNLTETLLGIEFDQQAAIMNMQQQEHELRTAAALSQQSGKLNYLLETQKIKLTEQEKQFNMLIARQLERQALLEAQLKTQQDRINDYIQTLTAQPTTVPTIHLPVSKDLNSDSKISACEEVESKSLLQKLQLEKLYLENTLDSLKENHEKEISILDDSYKKQITFLEEAMVHMEKRMQDDMESLEADYKQKIQRLKDEMTEMEKCYKSEKNTMKEENLKLIQEIRDQHSRSLKTLQKEHIETIERITKSKESECQAIEIIRNDGTNVQNVLNKSQVIIDNLEDLRKKFDTRDNIFIESQERHLKIQEENIEYLKKTLEKQKDAFDEEKRKLIGTIQKLESETAELISEFRKQNDNFKESEQILKSREQSLLRDREIFIEQSNWERDRLQAMRDTWAKEHDTQLERLVEERQVLAAEKGKLQTFNRLKMGEDESSKFELEAAMMAAQDAIASANHERLKWKEKVHELKMQKSTLQDKENKLILKAKELQEFTQSAVDKREEGLRALKEANFIEERYKEKLSQIKKQEEILVQRESKLAAEKLELAKERLALRVVENDKPEKDVNRVDDTFRCVDGQSSHSEVPHSAQYSSFFKDIVDPHLVLLKLDIDNKLGSNDFPFVTSY